MKHLAPFLFLILVLSFQTTFGGVSLNDLVAAKADKALQSGDADLQILDRPKPVYTDAARAAQIEGTVTLRVWFLKEGVVGHMDTFKGLSRGLTEQAMAAAKKIKFKPAVKNGRPVSVSRILTYDFAL